MTMNRRIRRYTFVCIQGNKTYEYKFITFGKKARNLYNHYRRYNDRVQVRIGK